MAIYSVVQELSLRDQVLLLGVHGRLLDHMVVLGDLLLVATVAVFGAVLATRCRAG